eukprot:CAMPEP_0182927700 /NCGR_PEP_ID=MMETSP0105_2-20130417/13923_1 /TAXON_ID=81532 ORGANISM="Acanthoeca-like sp., Strain 10tr" /NCGR_SAMPLE_ID=MMETSP0105_2 /ASSEMBLY_ACC=CAM_ASM_000205 /LENGTH=401 /DNA_ID=CAMNT_0025065659 /DNA_START=23 /DNA_END=1228 /DNA_ORIENTATION=-
MAAHEMRGMASATESKNTNSYNRQNWEDAEFPVLCETCLGPNPYVRMTKEKYGKECKVCERPFTVFRWCPGAGMRFKKTEVCQTCAKLKNVCQTCLLDLQYGLPTQVRDAALAMEEKMPTGIINREYYTQNAEAALADGINPLDAAQGSAKGHALLKKLARTTPYYKRNRAQICSFFVKGECRRGAECPYRHEMPTDPNDPLAKQNMKDRYYGTNDPVAEKMMRRASKMPSLDPPADKSITSLYIGGVEDPFVTKQDLQDYFYQFGEIRVINILKKQKAAFVHFTSRPAAEKAAENAHNRLIIKGRPLKVLWGRAQGQRGGKGGTGPAAAAALTGPPVMQAAPFMPPPPPGLAAAAAAPPGMPAPLGAPRGGGMIYPSMDPHRMGARSAAPMKGAHEKGKK